MAVVKAIEKNMSGYGNNENCYLYMKVAIELSDKA